MITVKKEEFLADLIDKNVDEKRAKQRGFYKKQFTNRRINLKYVQLAKRYSQFTDEDEIFSQMVGIIVELVKDKEYIKISKTGRNDEISWIITTAEQRMWDYIQENYTMNFISHKNNTKKVCNHFVHHEEDGTLKQNCIVSLDDYTYIGDGNFMSNHEIYEIGDYDPTEYEYYLGLQKLNELMDLCKLTTSQKDIILTLENTRDVDGGIYNISEAARMLGKHQQSVSRSWVNIKNKMEQELSEINSMCSLTTKTVSLFEDMIDFCDDELDVFEYIKNNISNPNVVSCLYKVDGNYRKEVIKALKEKKYNKTLFKAGMVYFLKEIHIFLDKVAKMHK